MNTGDSLVLGLDGGTEGMRAGLFTLEGAPVGFVREAYPSSFPRPGWAEQSPSNWWDAARTAVRKLLSETGIDPKRVAGIGLACTSFTMVWADSNGSPLRPAMMWMDVRSRDEAETVAATGDPVLRYSGSGQASAEWMPSKALWIKRHEPRIYEESTWVADYVEWIGFKLTRERAVSINSAAIRCYYDRLRGGWPVSLFNAIGIGDIVDKFSDRILNLGEVIGQLSADVAEDLGLPAGIPVAQGGADAFIGMIGLGVVRPGKLALITGSSHLQLVQTTEPSYSPGLFGSYTDAIIPGQYTIEGGQSSTGSIINWFRGIASTSATLSQHSQGLSAAGLSGTELLQTLSAEAHKIRPGADGLMALDYWQGNRTPHIDADARGMLWGLSLTHTSAHIFKALIESVCYGTENVLRTLRGAGHEVEEVVACGGALNSPTWIQTHADVSGIPIRTTEVPEAVTLGAAILAATAAGHYSSVAEASDNMVRTSTIIEPNPAAHREYRYLMEQYLESYRAMSPLMARMAKHERDRGEAAQ